MTQATVFAYKFDFYVSSSGGDPYPIVRYLDVNGHHFHLLGPDSAVGGHLQVVNGATFYDVAGFDFFPNTWYTVELKLIARGGVYTAWLKPTPVTLAGPFPGSSTEASSATGNLGGTLHVQHFAPGLGAIRTAPLLIDNVTVARNDWVGGASEILFTDNFETVPGPDSFIPPWDEERITVGGGGGIYVDSGHTVDPTLPGNEVGALTATADYLGVSFSVPDEFNGVSIKGTFGRES